MPSTPNPEYFDYVSVAERARISPAQLARLAEQTRRDYPNDPMMFELRMLRTCRAIFRGTATLEHALGEQRKAPPASAA